MRQCATLLNGSVAQVDVVSHGYARIYTDKKQAKDNASLYRLVNNMRKSTTPV